MVQKKKPFQSPVWENKPFKSPIWTSTSDKELIKPYHAMMTDERMRKRDIAFNLLNAIGCDEKMRSNEMRYVDAVDYLVKKTGWSFNSCKNLVYIYQRDNDLV